MLVLITGGSGSGKSEFAENLTVSLGGDRTYIATMENQSEDAAKRIEKHKKQRSSKGFKTVECFSDVDKPDISGTAILECLTNLLANEMFSEKEENPVSKIQRGISALLSRCENLVIVTDDIFSGGLDYDETTLEYIKNMGALNCLVAEKADEVYEVSCGIANKIK